MSVAQGASSTTPTWLTLVVAILGILGVVAGQLVNSWRESRRWKREQEREDLRWSREAEKASREREYDLRKHWSEKRLDAYGDLLAVLDTWEGLAYTFKVGSRAEVYIKKFEDAEPVMEECSKRSGELAQRVGLLGSEEIQPLVLEARISLDACLDMLVLRSFMPDDHAVYTENILKYSVKVDKVESAMIKLREALRKDLGITYTVATP
ncbi:hypothetical protein NLX83_13795 [Allokutzneria sp. A3M-2-11 16]|uniref:hypothetical protein n=1 Tax=Allokutzneria sp. A3M-2-11 16 TaxID=2962043 RepID=UPI0020B7BF10|nr:hypothetical protein [Allokutzneria sp. A3M-2-11 16]MCP3800332.1 hypothetical protein [Allokutzneria sp. A3M-2-11 16]